MDLHQQLVNLMDNPNAGSGTKKQEVVAHLSRMAWSLL
jgi:hypothetical protein